ncbi:MAG: hypothetical protein Q8S20_21950 [Sulfuritalea sp.]|nr:hypothetical protein [Sulfuritalea sp.]
MTAVKFDAMIDGVAYHNNYKTHRACAFFGRKKETTAPPSGIQVFGNAPGAGSPPLRCIVATFDAPQIFAKRHCGIGTRRC